MGETIFGLRRGLVPRRQAKEIRARTRAWNGGDRPRVEWIEYRGPGEPRSWYTISEPDPAIAAGYIKQFIAGLRAGA